jgi:AraC-like DNA-binding protein
LRSDGTWSQPQYVTSFRVRRPWYASIPLILVYIFVGLGIIIFIIDRVSRKRVKAMEEKLRASDMVFTGKIEQYLDEHLSDAQLTVDRIAKDMAMSRAALYHKMSTAYGKGVAEVLEEKRMLKAEELLCSSSLSVLDISEKVGYSTSRYFSTRFKQTHNGETPLKYRQTHR